MKKVKELRSTNWLSQNSHGDVKYSIGNIVNNILIIKYTVKWVIDLLISKYVMSNHWVYT